MPALSYRQVSDLYNVLKDAGATRSSLPEWSREMDAASGSDVYAAGLQDNLLKRLSVGLDRGIESIPGLIPAAEGFGRFVGEGFGMPEEGARIGRTLPRTAANFAPMLIPGVGLGATLARIGGLGLLQGAGTYTETGSPAAGIISGLTAAAMPKVADLAEQGILRGLGGRHVAGQVATHLSDAGLPVASEAVSRYFPTSIFQRLAAFTGGNAAAAGLMEGSSLGQEALSGQPLHNPFSKQVLLENVLGILPFSAAHAVTNFRGFVDGGKAAADKLQASIDKSQKLFDLKAAVDQSNQKSDIEKVPILSPDQIIPNAEATTQAEALLASLQSQRDSIKLTPDEQNVEKLKPITEQENAAIDQLLTQTGGVGMGTSLPKATDQKVSIIGENRWSRDQPNGKGYHTITVSNDPRNAGLTYPDGSPVQPGDRIRFPMGFADPEVNKNDTDPTYLLPKNKFTKIVDKYAEQVRDAQDKNNITGFKTSQGSTYTVDGQTTQRTKSLHQGHDPKDVGLKQKSDTTVYVDPETAREIGMWQTGSFKDKRVTLTPEGDILLTSVNPTTGQRGRDKLISAGKFTTTPEIGKSPLELWSKDEVGYKNSHPGNAITDLISGDSQNPLLPAQRIQLDLDQHAQNIKTLDALEVEANTMTSYGEMLDLLTKVNSIREQAGYPEMDLATLIKRGKAAGIKGDKALALSLVNETKMMQLAEAAAKSDRLGEMQGEVDFQAKLHERAQKGDVEAQNVLRIYDELSGESGRRGEIATSGLFWQKAMELDAKGELTASRMGRWKEGDVVAQGTGLKKNKEGIEKPEGIYSREIDPEDAALAEIVVKAAMNAMKGTPYADEARVFKHLIIRQDLTFTHESVAEAALDSGVVDTRAEAGVYATEFLETPHVQQWARQVLGAMQGNEKPPMLQGAPKEFVPTNSQQMESAKGFVGDGHTLITRLEQSSTQEVRQIVSDIKKNFPNLLSLIRSQVSEVNGSHAQLGADKRVTIHFSPDILGMSAFNRDNITLHELIHGLTMNEVENSSRPELLRELDTLRKSVIDSLPKDLRESYDKAIKSDWYRRNIEDKTGLVWQELAPDHQSRALLYSLLNNHEFLAQGFTSPELKNFLQKIPSKNGHGSLWNKFTVWVKGVLKLGQNVSDTAFEKFLGLGSQLMSHGEFQAGAQKYGESFFLNKGYDISRAREQTTRALGIIGESAEGMTKEQLLNSLNFTVPENNPRLRKAEADAAEVFNGSEGEQLKQLLQETGHSADVQGLRDFTDNFLSEGALDAGLFLDALPPEASRYIFERVQDNYDVLDALRAMTKKDKLTNIADASLLRRPVREVMKEMQELLAHQTRQEEAAQDLVPLSAVEPSGYIAAIAGAPHKLESLVGDTKDTVSGVGKWVSRFLEPMGQLARRMPEAAEILSKGFELGANARKFFNDVVKPFGIDRSSDVLDPNPSKDSIKLSQKVFSNPKLLDAANKWIEVNNVVGKDKVVMLPDSNPQVAQALSKLTIEERAAVHDVVSKQSASIQALHAKKIDVMTQIAAVHGAGVVIADGGMKPKDAVALSDTLLKGIMDLGVPERNLVAQSNIASVQQRMQPEAFHSLLVFLQGEAQKIQAVDQFQKANPGWATARRMERYLVNYSVNGKPKTGQASSMVEAREIAAKGKHAEIVDQWKGREDEPFGFPDMPPEMADRMRQIEENQIQMLLAKGVLTPDQEQAFRQSSSVTQILREAGAQNKIPGHEQARNLSKLPENLPWLWNHISYAQKESNYWTRQLLRAQARTYLRDPELAKNPELRANLKQHFENLLHPDPQLASNMRKVMSTWFLGFNAATGMVNALQPLFTHAAELTAMTGKPLDSYKRLFRAMKEIGGRSVEGKDWASEEHRRFQEDAVHDGEVGIGKYDDDAAAQESIATNFKRLMMKNKTQSTGQRLSTAAGAYSDAAMWLFQHGERFNARVALLSAFDMYREKGLSYEDAKQKAYEFNRAVNFSGGRAQRSIGLYSGQGAFPRGAAMIASALQSYVWGTTFQIARYLQRGGYRPSGLTPHEVYSARKAGVQLLATQLVAAGGLGLPFVSGAIALLDKLFPDLELNKNLRQTVSGFLGSDEENGSILSDIAMTGVPSALGWDLQSRMSMGNTLPGVSEVNGFQAENLLGPAGNLVRNFVGGVTGWAQGRPGAGLKFLPPAIAKVVEAGTSALTDNGQIRDYAGRPLEDAGGGEKLGRFLGFQPKRLSDQNAASRILKQSEEVQARQESQFRSEQAEQVLRGNFGNVKQSLLARKRADDKFDLAQAVRGIARSAEEQYFPRDLRREGSQGTARARDSVLNSYLGINQAGPSEVNRLQFRKKVESQLGLQSDWDSELKQALLMDQLASQTPGATRVELRAAAQRALRRSTAAQVQLE